jgi:hypothetical protein
MARWVHFLTTPGWIERGLAGQVGAPTKAFVEDDHGVGGTASAQAEIMLAKAVNILLW